ncbi:GMC oxidoreductase [Myxosarcina sp. GI1]|uniref:GMC oxidoreductase n=1 Tax=Myxosarcina sp. GI1 TaxID=1541065 RepID=UPI000564239B|nr:GMC family oxidoreductase [Myxosarcina sp. GI1]
MLIDARTLPEDTVIEQDICIIGAGAAGITLAREFIDRSEQVCLLESGGMDFDEATQSLYGDKNIGNSYYPLKETRARYLGGSTNLWGGWSRPLDEIDFEDRPWMPNSGWSIARDELVPYYQRAQQVCNLGPFEYELDYWQDRFKQRQYQPLPTTAKDITTCLWQIIPPTHLRFGQVFKTELERAKNIDTYLYANVVDIETNDTAQSVTRLRVATLEGKKFWIAAKAFVLATGGIENPRLLLAANKVQNTGLGNQYDRVGRYFMEHPYIISGRVRLFEPLPLYTQKNFQLGEMFMGVGLGLTKEVQKREQLLNFGARLLPLQEEWVESFNRLRGRQKKGHKAFPTIHEGRKYGREEVSVLEDALKVMTNLDRIALKAYEKLSKSKITALTYDTHLIAEQAPNPDSRVTLSSERDRLGLNRAKLDWRLTPLDKHTIKRSQEIITGEIERLGLGKATLELTDESSWQHLTGSYHHMGTTRMDNNPRHGVVNENCRVHGVSNLYVAGSSVFPTSGLSNPTLTIIALSIRLADYLKTSGIEDRRGYVESTISA